MFVFLVSPYAFSADMTGAPDECNMSCKNEDRLSLNIGEKSAVEILNKFKFDDEQLKDHKKYFGEIKSNLLNINLTRKSIKRECLVTYCKNESKKNVENALGNGISIKLSNPICDSSDDDIISDVKVLIYLREFYYSNHTFHDFRKKKNLEEAIGHQFSYLLGGAAFEFQ
jgi:hypothetical protein